MKRNRCALLLGLQLLQSLGLPAGREAAAAAAAAAPVWHVPPGFRIEPAVSPPGLQFPMFATLDEQGRLYVTESSGGDLYVELQTLTRHCRISVLEDRDGDGQYETSRIFADHLTPAMGLVWHDGKLYAADPPDLVALADTDSDGRADQRRVILSGFGHSDNGSLHGLTFGPDGWLYFTTGHPDGYDLTGPDGTHAKGTAGALIRCRPDGSKVETVARGFENLVEIEFLPDGSIIGTLTWYKLPDQGTRDALIQILEGGVFPLHPTDSAPHLEFTGVLPPLALFPAVAHSGLALYRGRAFPAELRGDLFSAEHNSRKIVRHQLTPKGASYAVTSHDFVTTDDPDVHFSDVLEDQDGSLLIVDTGSWYVQHCPTGRIRQAPARGGIYRVSFGQARPQRMPLAPVESPDLQRAMRGTNDVIIAAAARAAGRSGQSKDVPALNALLHSPNAGLRLAAAEALARVGDSNTVPALVEALAGQTDPFLEHALTYALWRRAETRVLLALLDRSEPKLQRAGLLLLDQPPFQAVPKPAVIARLQAVDSELRATARWVLRRHPDWGDAGADFLRQLVAQPDASADDREALRQFLPLFHTNAAVISALQEALLPAPAAGQEAQQVRLLDALAGLDLSHPLAALGDAVLQILRAGSAATRSSAVRLCVAWRVPGAEAALGQVARDATQPAGLRLQSLRALIRRRPTLEPAAMEFLLEQLSGTNSPAGHLGAAEALSNAKLSPPQVSRFLEAARADPLLSPASVLGAVERAGLDASDPVALLDYLAASLDAGWTLPAESLAKVKAAVPEAQQARAAALITRLSENIDRQRQELAAFAPLLKGGDAGRGEKLFFDKAQCTACHRVWENGGRVGPDLTRIGRIRSGRDLLESLLFPSSTIAQGYDTLTATTKDGESYTGVRVGQSEDPLVLRLAGDTEVTLHPRQIERLDRSKASLMPEGLLRALTRDEVRDLLGYLQQLR